MIQHVHHEPTSPKNLPGASLVNGTAGGDIMPPQTGEDRRRKVEDQRGIEEDGPNRRKKKPSAAHMIAWLGGE